MSTKLFVGGLPWAMDNQRLKEVFAAFGDVEDARVILDRETGRSRGFGFVTYTTAEAAEKALELNGQEVDGRRIRVDRAQEKERRGRGGGGGRPRGEGGGRPGGGRDFGGGGGGGGGGGARPEGGRPEGGRPEGGRGGGGRREFNDDWGRGGGGGGGGGDRDRGRRGKGKGRGRRRGGRGARGGGGEGFDGPPPGFDEFDDWD